MGKDIRAQSIRQRNHKVLCLKITRGEFIASTITSRINKIELLRLKNIQCLTNV